MVWESAARGDKAGVSGGGSTDKKERVWNTRISSRLVHKQDELKDKEAQPRTPKQQQQQNPAWMTGAKEALRGVCLPGPAPA